VGTWVQSIFAQKWLKLSKKMGIFLEMDVSPKKDLHFLHGSLGAAFPRGEPWMHAPFNPPLIKWIKA